MSNSYADVSETSEPPGSQEQGSSDRSRGKSTKRKKADWENQHENLALIDSWKTHFRALKKASGKMKSRLWLKIHTRFQDLCRERNVKSDSKDLAQIKSRVKNLEYEFKQVKMRMNQTGEEGAEKIKKDCSYYEELNSFLGNRDAINPDRMNITSTEIKTVLSESAEDEPDSPASTVILSDVDREGDIEDDEEFLQPLSKKVKKSFEQKLQKSDSEDSSASSSKTGRGKVKSKRTLAQLATEELNEVKEMWSRSIEKQEEQFYKFCELQQSSIKAQEHQTVKMLSGLKEIFKDLFKEQ